MCLRASFSRLLAAGDELHARSDRSNSARLLATQCCHAGVALYKKVRVKNAGIVQSWEESSQRKVVLFTPNEPSLVALQKALREKGGP